MYFYTNSKIFKCLFVYFHITHNIYVIKMSEIIETVRLNIEINKQIATRFYNYLMKRYGKIRGKVSEELEKAIVFYLENASAPGADAPAGDKLPEDKNFENQAEGPVILDANYFFRVLGHWPKTARKEALIKILQRKGLSQNKAKILINTLIAEGVYEEKNGMLYLRKEVVA